MTKRMNFPERKKQRRIDALERQRIYLDTLQNRPERIDPALTDKALETKIDAVQTHIKHLESLV